MDQRVVGRGTVVLLLFTCLSLLQGRGISSEANSSHRSSKLSVTHPFPSLEFPIPFDWIIKEVWRLLGRWSHEIRSATGRACASAMLDILNRGISLKQPEYVNGKYR